MLAIQSLQVFPGGTKQSSVLAGNLLLAFPLPSPSHPLFRELLTDHRVPGLLLEAMKVAVKKQRKKIKAKMLGTPEEAEGSDDEDDSWLLLSNDKEDAPLVPGSRIQNFFSLWYRGETEAPEAETSSTAPSNLQEGEAAPQHPHLEPVGSLPAPDS